MKLRVLHVVLIVFLSAFVGYYFGTTKVSYEWKNYSPKISFVNKEPPLSLSTVDFSLFWNVWQRIESKYYDRKAFDKDKLLYGAVTGMVQSLGDPYTVFLPPVKNSDFKKSLAGEQFEGIGAELGLKGKQIIIIAALDESPAQRAGIKPADAIIKVDGQSTEGWTLTQTVDKIRGKKGTTVMLTLLHKDESSSIDIPVVRDTIHVKSVTGWVKKVSDISGINVSVNKEKDEPRIAYMRISQFGDNANTEWLSVVNSLMLAVNKERAAFLKDPIAGLILDVRNNPGGYLNDATFIASEFIKSGTVVIQEKGNGERTTFSVERQGLFTEVPMVILINKGSASASEIVASALRDYKRAKLVGETSFGKGTIQEAQDLGNGVGLHVTIAKWLTPNGTWINGKGLTPDVTVSADDKDQSHDVQLEKAVLELVK